MGERQYAIMIGVAVVLGLLFHQGSLSMLLVRQGYTKAECDYAKLHSLLKNHSCRIEEKQEAKQKAIKKEQPTEKEQLDQIWRDLQLSLTKIGTQNQRELDNIQAERSQKEKTLDNIKEKRQTRTDSEEEGPKIHQNRQEQHKMHSHATHYSLRAYNGGCWKICKAHPLKKQKSDKDQRMVDHCNCFAKFTFWNCAFVRETDCDAYSKGGAECVRAKKTCGG